MSEELKITGTIIAILPEVTGVSKANKEWRKREFVIETKSEYPKKVVFQLFNDKVALIDKYAEGSEVEVKFNLSANEFNGKYYTSVDAWFISGEEKAQSTTGGGNFSTGLSNLPPSEMATQNQIEDDENNLPF